MNLNFFEKLGNAIQKTIEKEEKEVKNIEIQGINKEFDLDLFAQVIRESVSVELNDNEEDCNIAITIPIIVCVNTYENSKILTVLDIYSSKNALSIQNDDFVNHKNCEPEILEGKIEGNVVLIDSEPRIDKYLATTNVCANVSNTYVNDGKIIVEGVVTANIIYLNDELGSVQSVQIEVPFVLDKKSNISQDALLEQNICLFDVDTMVKRGREIYFDAKVKAYINVTCSKMLSFVSKIESVGEIPARCDAIEIYFGKTGESFWDIAKNLKIPSEIIRNQNPNLSDPLEADQNIALYFQKERAN